MVFKRPKLKPGYFVDPASTDQHYAAGMFHGWVLGTWCGVVLTCVVYMFGG